MNLLKRLTVLPVAAAFACSIAACSSSKPTPDQPAAQTETNPSTEAHKAPVVAVNVWYHVGSKDENRDEPASRTSSST